MTTHNYASNGTFYAIVAGCVDEITSFLTTGTVIMEQVIVTHTDNTTLKPTVKGKPKHRD